MLTLNRLYSETDLFDAVRFHPGINVVLGKYSGAERSVNGIGKSTLVRLIDYALLSNTPFTPALAKYRFLQGHNVALEFSDGESVFVVKRSFDDRQTAYFGERGSELNEYTVAELKDVFGTRFFMSGLYPGGYASSHWFRTLMKFFIKDDVNRRKQDNPVNFIAPQTKMTEYLYHNFFLLGLPNYNLFEFGRVREEVRRVQVTKKDVETQIEANSKRSAGELRSEKRRVEDRIAQLERSLEEFAFIENYKDAEAELVQLSRAISERLSTYHALRAALERHEESYQVVIEVDADRIASLYRDYSQQLGDLVRKTLKEVVDFRKQIAANRQRFLAERERELRDGIEHSLGEISLLEGRRQRLYRLLHENGAFDSIRHTYEQLIQEKVSLERDHAALNRLAELDAELARLKTRAAELIEGILADVNGSESVINDLRHLFDEILEAASSVPEDKLGGYLDIEATAHQVSPVNITVHVPKSASLGKKVFGILAYELTVFFNIVRNERELPYFLVHDGAFHGIDPRTTVNVLNYVYRQSQQTPGFQYIITGNENELLIPPAKENVYGTYEFDFAANVVATYEDVPARMFFRHEFD